MDFFRWPSDNRRMRIRFLLCWVMLLSSALAQTTTSTTSVDSSSSNPIRSSESHSEADGHTSDKQSLERIGMDGRYVPYLDVEKESVQVNSNTVKTIERTYGRDADGRKTLTQVVEEVKSTQPGGSEKVVRNTSNPDADGRLQLVKREIADTRQSSANVAETKTTSYTIGADGQMVPSLQTDERRTRTNEHDTQFRRSTQLPDLNGNWQVQEIREGVIKDDDQQQMKDERVSRPDNDGRMAVVERTVTASGKGGFRTKPEDG